MKILKKPLKNRSTEFQLKISSEIEILVFSTPCRILGFSVSQNNFAGIPLKFRHNFVTFCAFPKTFGACIQTKHLKTGSSASSQQLGSCMFRGHIKRGWGSYIKTVNKLLYSLKYIFLPFCPGTYILLKLEMKAPIFKECLILRLLSWKPLIRGFRKWSMFWLECRKMVLGIR